MKILNSKGPSIDPCGTTASTAVVALALLLITTIFLRFLNNYTLELTHPLRNRMP